MADSFEVWRPYEASAKDPWDLCKVAHLHRRAGFGASWIQLQHDLEAGPAQSIDRLLDPPDENNAFMQISDAMLRSAGGPVDADTFSSERDSRRGAEWWLY